MFAVGSTTEVETYVLFGFIFFVLFCVIWIISPTPKDSVSPAQEHQDAIDEVKNDLSLSYSSMSQFLAEYDELRRKYLTENKIHHLEQLDGWHDYFLIGLEVKKHHSALSRNLEIRIKRNDYGKIISDDRWAEINEFLESIEGFKIRNFQKTDEAAGFVLSFLEQVESKLTEMDFDPSAIPDDGLAFEHWVASNLKKFDWDAKATVGSGDQGLDVLAEKDGVKVGIQCKLYSGNVGNKAVQEVIAARTHFRLDKVCVLTNSNYTKSARELAQSSGVLLLTQHDIPRFDELFL
jgi:hypothetical protein